MSRLPLRTRVMAALLDRMFPTSGLVKPGGIERMRHQVMPARAPFTWITGPVPKGVQISDTWFEARDGASVAARVYRPATAAPLPVVVYYHGGGFVINSTKLYDPLAAQIAARVGALVISIDYRMAPEHRAPQAVLDAVDGLRWAAGAAADFGGDAAYLAVAGDSAGGNLAALVCHSALDDGGPAIRHQALLYPGTDLSLSFPSVHENADAPVLNAAMVTEFLDIYLGPEPAMDRRDPRISPYWRPDLSGLPPALVITADYDPIRDEGRAYAARLAAAGVPVRATNSLGVPHAFFNFPGATWVGRQALYELVTELHRHLRPSPAGAIS